MIEIVDFASSSKGNCYLVRNEETIILLECGVDKKSLLKYLMGMGINIAQINACLTTHSHTDHSLIVDYVSDYIDTYGTRELHNKYNNIIELESKKPIRIGTIKVLPISVEHASCENNAFIFLDKDSTIFFGTDFSLMEQNVSNFAFDKIYIECNYNDELLDMTLKENDEQNYKYIRQVSAHLSSSNCILHLKHFNLSKCKEIVLLHPSSFLIGKKKTIEEFEATFNIPTRFAKEK